MADTSFDRRQVFGNRVVLLGTKAPPAAVTGVLTWESEVHPVLTAKRPASQSLRRRDHDSCDLYNGKCRGTGRRSVKGAWGNAVCIKHLAQCPAWATGYNRLSPSL